MFFDACAIIALLSDEPEADRVSDALVAAEHRMTSAVAVLEAALGLARADKFGLSVATVEPPILEFLDKWRIEIRDLPPATETTRTALSAGRVRPSDERGMTGWGERPLAWGTRFRQGGGSPFQSIADSQSGSLQIVPERRRGFRSAARMDGNP